MLLGLGEPECTCHYAPSVTEPSIGQAAGGRLLDPRYGQGGAQSHFGCSCGVLRVGVQAQEGQE